MFRNSPAIIYVPLGMGEAYKAKEYWNNYAANIQEKEMDEYSFKVTAPEGYATYYNEYPYKMPEGVKGAVVTEVNANGELGVQYCYEAGDVVPALTPLLLLGEEAKQSFYYLVSGNEDTSPNDNLLCGTLKAETPEDDGSLFYMLSYDENDKNIGFYWGAPEGKPFENGANKAYLKLTREQAAKMKGFRLGDGSSTAIDGVQADGNDEKSIYTLDGMRVKAANAPGVYIVDGKKKIVK